MHDVNSKRYWLIGASEGVGRALANKLSRTGAEVIVSARNEDRLRELVQQLPGRAMAMPVDVTDRAALEAAAQDIGAVDTMVYLSGVLTPMTAQRYDTAEIEKMLDVNLLGAARAVGAVLPGMLERGTGRIVLTGSLSAYRGMSGFLGYAASKAGLMSFAESLRADLNESGITVQIANPGYIRTNMTAGMKGRMPLRIEPEQAAERIFDLMQSERFARNFPLPTGLAAQMMQLMPDWLYFTLMGRKN